MKRILILIGISILFLNFNAYSAIEKSSKNQNVVTVPGQTTLPTKTELMNRTRPATSEEIPQAIVEGHVEPPPPPPPPAPAPPPEQQIPPDRSSGDPVCAEQYYCVSRLNGTSVYCQYDGGNVSHGDRECNRIANICRDCKGHTQNCAFADTDFLNKHCK